ncbi:hypothetical protein DSO57_1005474 [Entomophthora muscae]|uniref:Uncharacterized protein n=1 Tax=Entomophthora muscae TaxID=34485 RepID=A0ACC2U6E1_9FUNG|nr:hypothetical protein DSO57_1005474 [Entomophthora muscae]
MMHSTVEQTTTQIAAATAYIKGLLPQGQEVQVCIVCGSGLGGLADTLENTTTIKYSDIPHSQLLQVTILFTHIPLKHIEPIYPIF